MFLDIAWTVLALLAALAPPPGASAAAAAPPAAPAPAAPRLVKFVVPGASQATHVGTVALSDDLLAAGAVGYRSFSGAVFLFDRATGQQMGTLTRPGAQPHDWFGSAVAFDGDALIVGARDVGGVGYAARYDLATGAELVTYEPPVPVPTSQFGSRVVVDGDVVAVSAPGFFPFPPDEGQVHLFDRMTGAPLLSIASPDPTWVLGPTHFFGASLAAEDGLLVVGAPGTDFVGTAFVYELATGAMRYRLEPPPGFPHSEFGSAVAMGDGRVAVSDPLTDGYTGAVHVYDAATGDHLYTVSNPGGSPGTYFGVSVALDGTRLAVGDRHAELGAAQGVVTLYDATDGAALGTLTGYPAAATEVFGSSLALHGGVLAVGDEQDDQAAIDAGAAYLATFH